MTYKTLIPGLVTFESERKYMNNMYISSDFFYYHESNQKAKFHYTERSVAALPSQHPSYDMRSEYFFKEGPIWHYFRPSRILPLALSYNTTDKTFSYTRKYGYIPFGVGGIFPVGELIADVINYHLFLNNYVIMRGIAYTYNQKTICVTAPGFNGKTHFLDTMLQKGAEYIAEDLLVIDINHGTVYPTCPFVRRHSWQKDRALRNPKESIQITTEPQPIDVLYFVENSLSKAYTPRPKTFSDFLLINDRYFLKNRFVRSMIFEEGTWEKVLAITHSPLPFEQKFLPLQNFNYEALG